MASYELHYTCNKPAFKNTHLPAEGVILTSSDLEYHIVPNKHAGLEAENKPEVFSDFNAIGRLNSWIL